MRGARDRHCEVALCLIVSACTETARRSDGRGCSVAETAAADNFGLFLAWPDLGSRRGSGPEPRFPFRVPTSRNGPRPCRVACVWRRCCRSCPEASRYEHSSSAVSLAMEPLRFYARWREGSCWSMALRSSPFALVASAKRAVGEQSEMTRRWVDGAAYGGRHGGGVC